MSYDDFWNLVDISDDQKEKSIFYLNNRGIQDHINIARFLNSKLNRRPTYNEVATVFRYDKRIRRIIYKDIGLLEERLRAYICNKYTYINELSSKTIRYIKNDYAKNKKYFNIKKLKTYDYFYAHLFGDLCFAVKNLDNQELHELFPNIEFNSNELDRIAKLRNTISHNKTLIDSNKLLDDLKILVNYLPNYVSATFIEEINSSVKLGEEHRNNQVEWDLPSSVIIEIRG